MIICKMGLIEPIWQVETQLFHYNGTDERYWVGQKVCLGFFHTILWKNLNELSGQPSSYDFSHFTEKWSTASLGELPKATSSASIMWESPSLCSRWDFIGGSELCRGSRTSIWKLCERCRWPQDPSFSQGKFLGWAVCGSYSCLCQVECLETSRCLLFSSFQKSQSIMHLRKL